MKLTGGCSCGAIRFEVTEDPIATYYCHCSMCRRASGSMFQLGATVPIEGFKFVRGEPKAYESTPGSLRKFCGACGSPLVNMVAEDPKLVEYQLGCLDDLENIRPELHIHAASQASWFEVADDLPRHEEGAPELDKIWEEGEGWKAP